MTDNEHIILAQNMPWKKHSKVILVGDGNFLSYGDTIAEDNNIFQTVTSIFTL